MLRAQALTEDQQVDFVLGALEGTARREVRLLGERQTIDAMWEELDGRYGQPTPLPKTICKLQQEVRRQGSLTFRQVTTETHALEDLQGEGPASQTPAVSLATRELPVRPQVDLEQWKEEIKNELRRELQDQLAALGRTLVAELRHRGGTEARGADNNHPYAPFQMSTPSLIGGTSESQVWRCGTCAVEVPHSSPSWGSFKCQPPAMVGHVGVAKTDP
ncbi:hypothetical protein SKAU_G00277810 [Synaphobranchus kaupii]|uniref:Uncharacterized protein n=1 Tax=Synaphobranchus kaupii TaxID=118154 RepID=A0A9Q1EWK4_SYNKA|nr:hypothetical protein SKAU_G00277810 [Synaphobranchus kaupii]